MRLCLFICLCFFSSLLWADTIPSTSANTPSNLGKDSTYLEKDNIDSLTKNKETKDTVAKPTKRSKIYRFELAEPIFPSAWRKVKRSVEEAEKAEADYIFMRLNTYGGAVNDADSIRTKLLKTKPTVVVLIDNNAASAGALISLACDSIYMVKGAQIGAATVVNGSGQQMPDKYQSYMRATMRSTAEAQGRDPKIAEAMVDHRIEIKGVIDSTKTLTFTTDEAIKHGYCDGSYNTLDEVIAKLAPNAEQLTYSPHIFEGVIRFLLNPMVSGILLMLMFMGIYSEVQTPGVGFPLLAAVLAGTLYFAPNYLEGLAQHWEILAAILGVILIGVEIFALPGFGIAGVSGIILLVGGLTLSLVRNDFFDFTFTTTDEVSMKFIQVIASMAGAIILAFLLGMRLLKSETFRKFVLEDTQQADEGYTVKSLEEASLVGKTGVAVTDLNIAGRVEIDDERYEAITTGDFIDAGTEILVKAYKGNYLVVRANVKASDTEF